MNKTLKIEIKSDTEEGVQLLFQHIFREITEGKNYTNSNIDHNSRIENNEWLVIENKKLKGKYYWTKNSDI